MEQLRCHFLEKSLQQKTHSHPHAQIILPMAQPLLLQCDGRERFISPQQLGFIPPDCPHVCVCPDQVVTINIPSHMIKKADLEVISSQTVLPIVGVLVPLIQLIKEEIARDPESDSVRYLYYYLYDKLVETNGIRSLRYLRDHFCEPLRVEHLARLENYNLSYFSNWFKRQTGFTPACYLRQLRLEKAKELLLTTHYSVTDIALQVGYNSNSSFTRAFKEAEGIAPLAYRQKHELK